MKRVVLDTNVIIAALFWQGPPRVVYDLAREGQLIMLLTEKMEKEFIRGFGYTKFGLTSPEILPFVRKLRMKATHVARIERTDAKLQLTDVSMYANL